jgi:hypothetical protein
VTFACAVIPLWLCAEADFGFSAGLVLRFKQWLYNAAVTKF